MRFIIILILSLLGIYGTYELNIYYEKSKEVLKNTLAEKPIVEEHKPELYIIKPTPNKL